MSDPQPPDQDLPTPLRGLSAEQVEGLRQFFTQNMYCPRCEWPIIKKDVQPSEEDRKAFLRAVLGDGQFTKVYPLYDGKLKLTFSSLNTTQSLLLADLCKLVPAGSAYEQMVEQFRLKLLFYLVGKNDETYEPFNPPPPAAQQEVQFEQLREEYRRRFGKWNEGLLALAVRTLQEFIRLEDMLTNGGLDKSFWKSAGLV